MSQTNVINEEEFIQAICENNLVFLLQRLDKSNIDQRLESQENETALLFAISDGDSEIYKYFIENGASLRVQNNLGENILHSAIYSGKIDRVKEVQESVDINKRDNEGTTPLLLAIGLENEEISNHLIDSGANINLSDLEGNRPIHLASYFGLQSVVRRLLKSPLDLTCKTAKGNVPIALAANNDHHEIVKILYEKIYH
jgi:ankyrin repeat protein